MELTPPTARAARCEAFAGLKPGEGYACSPLHAPPTVWVEKNCYIDIWIEVLQGLQLDPWPLMAFTLAIDFEGDQWTFFKPPHNELYELYGLDVQELNIWRPLAEHALEHLAAGKLVSTEADAFWLPDTAGTDYRRQHTKTTIGLTEVDFDAGFAHYFHNAGFFRVEGEDFRQLFRLDAAPDEWSLPLFAEVVRTDRVVHRPAHELAPMARASLARHLARRPEANPVQRFAGRWAADLPLLQARGLPHYHAWAFSTLRQLGAGMELAAGHLRWLQAHTGMSLEAASASFELIGSHSKTLILKGARSVMLGKPLDASALLDDMAAAWQRGMDALVSNAG
ncbi:MAG: DUF1839 family protein [Pseudomonadota bacterium]